MFSSRTDKAHSQNGVTPSNCDEGFDDNRKTRYIRPQVKTETRAIVRDELAPAKAPKFGPGLKLIGPMRRDEWRSEADKRAAEGMRVYWAELEAERVANLERIAARHALTVQHMGWREVRLSNCEFGCKEYERTYNGERQIQVQHNSTYGCKKGDEPIIRVVRVVEHHAPKRQPVGFSDQARREGSLPIVGRNTGKHHANFDVETPSLMQLAQKRAQTLGLVK